VPNFARLTWILFEKTEKTVVFHFIEDSFGYKLPRRWITACKGKANGRLMSLAVQLSKPGRWLEPRVLAPP
jgi:hypothetical protein